MPCRKAWIVLDEKFPIIGQRFYALSLELLICHWICKKFLIYHISILTIYADGMLRKMSTVICFVRCCIFGHDEGSFHRFHVNSITYLLCALRTSETVKKRLLASTTFGWHLAKSITIHCKQMLLKIPSESKRFGTNSWRSVPVGIFGFEINSIKIKISKIYIEKHKPITLWLDLY